MRSKLLATGILSLALSASFPIVAQADSHMAGMKSMMQSEACQQCREMRMQYREQKMKKMHEMMQLTDDQKAKMKEIYMNKREQMKALRMKHRALRMEMNQMAMQKEVNQEQVNAMMEKVKALAGEKFMLQFNSKHQMFQLLTDEQRKMMSDRMMQRMQKMKQQQN